LSSSQREKLVKRQRSSSHTPCYALFSPDKPPPPTARMQRECIRVHPGATTARVMQKSSPEGVVQELCQAASTPLVVGLRVVIG
jgi:hypothetical protein